MYDDQWFYDAITAFIYDRKDLVDKVPLFFGLAERKIFRTLRVPANEAVHTWNVSIADDALPTPADYLEAKLMRYGGSELTRITDGQHLRLSEREYVAGIPRTYARIGTEFYLHPWPSSDGTATMIYWRDLSGVADNEVRRLAPELFIYGALISASSYLAQDSRIPTWTSVFEQALSEVVLQGRREEQGSSPRAIASVYDQHRKQG